MNGKQFFNAIALFLIGVGLFNTSFLIGCEGKGRIPVSYTHLDVYKRQI